MNHHANNQSIVQWNCQGIRNKKNEIQHLINIHKPAIIALQEVKLQNSKQFKVPGYVGYRREGHFNRTPHGGVALYVHQDIPHSTISLNTNIQAIALTVRLGRKVTICSLYSSRSHALTEQELDQLTNQLPPPIIILGDFNSYSTIWGCETTDARGRIIENFVSRNNLNLLNTGSPTRISYGSESAIDLSICSPQLEPSLEWNALSTPMDSDHCPIIITSTDQINNNNDSTTKYDYRKGDWGTYENLQTWKNLPESVEGNPSNWVEDFYSRLQEAAETTIPQFTTTRYFPKPWWCRELTEARKRRETLPSIPTQQITPQYHRLEASKSGI